MSHKLLPGGVGWRQVKRVFYGALLLKLLSKAAALNCGKCEAKDTHMCLTARKQDLQNRFIPGKESRKYIKA